MGAVRIGIDIGQRVDPTAIAVLESDWRPVEEGSSRKEEHFLTRFLERLPLGTPYPQIARRLAQIAQKAWETAGSRPTIALDATGVGTPILDVLKEARVAGELQPVYFTHGDRRTVVEGKPPEIRLGKAFLVSRLQALLQSGRIHLPETEEARVLAKELMDYEIRVDQDANDRYGAFKVGSHDDLVTALGLAVQIQPHGNPIAGLLLCGSAKTNWFGGGDSRRDQHIVTDLRTGETRPGRQRIKLW